MITAEFQFKELLYLLSVMDGLNLLSSPSLPETVKQEFLAGLTNDDRRTDCFQKIEALLQAEKARQEQAAGLY
jgi:hypothetical protein